MTTIQKSDQGWRSQLNVTVDINRFVSDQITRSWGLTIWLLILTFISVRFVLSRLADAPVTTTAVLVVWAVTVSMVIVSEVTHKHNATTLWMKNNLYNNITNVQLSLIIMLAVLAAIFGLYDYSWTRASFTTIPATDIRAEVGDISSDTYCFNIGAVDPEGGTSTIIDARNTCFAASMLTTDLTGVDIRAEATSFCFDEVPDDPENGITCFQSSANNPGFFEVTNIFSGANWGAVAANMTSLMIFRFNRNETWRITATILLIVVLAIPSFFVYRDSFNNRRIRQNLTYVWLVSPLISYMLLRGIPDVELQSRSITSIIIAAFLLGVNWYISRHYPPGDKEIETVRLGRTILLIATIVFAVLAVIGIINVLSVLLLSLTRTVDGVQQPLFVALDPDVDWGGFLFTIIITVFAIVVSFPLGVMLALGRRSQVRGIPAWLTYLVATAITVWGLLVSTPANLAQANNTFGIVVSYWPVLVPIAAYLFQRTWNGNVVAAFSTIYIEFVRGIPFIAVLFLALVLFPLLLPDDFEIAKVWRVMWGATFFAAAYLAENVRGGLQAIPNGQYEAADSLGFNSFDKYRLIILPQALRIVIPAIVGQFIGLFKDTTLVAIIGFLDILGVANAISAQPQWLGVRREAYLFLAVLYFFGSWLMAAYSRRLEKRLGVGER